MTQPLRLALGGILHLDQLLGDLHSTAVHLLSELFDVLALPLCQILVYRGQRGLIQLPYMEG